METIMAEKTNELMTAADIEREYCIKANTLRDWRYLGKGPEYIKLGDGRRGHVLYKRAVIEQWLEAQTVRPG
jgi:hypothetical protein